jgi:hypothetical protein
MRVACQDLTQNKKCTPTNMHPAIGVMWSWFMRSLESCNHKIFQLQIRIMNVWISTSIIVTQLNNAWSHWINLNVGPSVRLFDTFKQHIFQIIPAVQCRLNYTLQVSKLRLFKIKLLPAGHRVLSNTIRGCWLLYFNGARATTGRGHYSGRWGARDWSWSKHIFHGGVFFFEALSS